MAQSVRKKNPAIRVDYDPSYDGLVFELVQDQLAELIHEFPCRIEDVGVGAYEYWGATGVDSQMAATLDIDQDVIEVWIHNMHYKSLNEEVELGEKMHETSDVCGNYEVTLCAYFKDTRWDTKLFQTGDDTAYFVVAYRLEQE
tara:strand:+ start:689 stop:1117 length:429 start_codon:yes stop_codon:yes gene_type:complete